MARQCPNCRTITSFSEPVCAGCGLQFFKPRARVQNLTGICLRIGGAAILLAAVAAVVIVLFRRV
jgi:hypothetical protein